MLSIISHEGNANQHQNELPLHITGMAIKKQTNKHTKTKTQLKITSVWEDVEKNGTINIVGGNADGKLVWLLW